MDVYSGNAPYIFVSYAHADSEIVLPIIENLQNNGFRLWFDKGIEAGTEWPQYIAEHLDKSQCVMVFMSKNSASSHNCRNEISLAAELKKEILVIYLEEFELPLGLRLQLNLSQALYKTRSKNDSEFYNELFKAKILLPYRSTSENASTSIPTAYGNNSDPIKLSENKESPSKLKKNLIIIAALVAVTAVALIIVLSRTNLLREDPAGEPALSPAETTKNIIVDYQTFFETVVSVTDALNYNYLWTPSSLLDSYRINQDDGDEWITYYPTELKIEGATLNIGFCNGGQEVMVVLDDLTDETVNDAYKLLECISDGVSGYYLEDIFNIMTDDEYFPWKECDFDAHSIWNEVLELVEPAFSRVDDNTTMHTFYKLSNTSEIVIYIEKRERLYSGKKMYDFTVIYDSLEEYYATHPEK